jgi:hypothetical protein
MKIMDSIIKYADNYLAYAVSLPPAKRYGLDYAIGLNMQTFIEIYRMGPRIGEQELSSKTEPGLNRYYSILYSSGR